MGDPFVDADKDAKTDFGIRFVWLVENAADDDASDDIDDDDRTRRSFL